MGESGIVGQDASPAPGPISGDDPIDPIQGRLEGLRTWVPAWRHAQLTVTRLSGGMTNLNYLVVADGASYVLRIGGNATDLLGIDREAEYAASTLAAGLGIGPEVIAFPRPEAYLVTRFVEGKPISPGALRDPSVLVQIAGALRRFHAGDRIHGHFSSFRMVERYAAVAARFSVAPPAAFARARGELRRLERVLYPLGEERAVSVPCHNDLLNANFLQDAERIWIIDWEYAGMGDRYFDLANLSANHGFSDLDDHALLGAYFGLDAPDPARFARLQLMRGMSLFREAMWGLAQQGISTIEFDFTGYTERHFHLLGQWLARPEYSRWLAEASGPE